MVRAIAAFLFFVGLTFGQPFPNSTTSSGGSASTPLNVRVLCQNTVAGSPYSEPATNGAAHSCDSAWSSADGSESFTNGATNYALLGPYNLSSAFADPLKLTIWSSSSSTSGSFKPSVAVLCLASGGAITTNWWAAASYTNFTSTATSGTAGIITSIAPLSYTTGCGAGLMYLSFRATAADTPALGAGIKLLVISGIQ